MKKILSLLLAAGLLVSCSPKKEAIDLYDRIMDFFRDNKKVVTEIFEDDKPSANSDIEINVKENTDNTVSVNITDNNDQVLDVNIDQDTYEEYDYLIESAKEYVASNDVDVNKLMNDKAYMMKHGLKFARDYDIDLNSLSSEDIAKLQSIFNN